MSTEQDSNGSDRVLMFLVPETIATPEITNVRPFSSKADPEREIEAINELMLSIEQEGLIEPVVVMPIKDAKPEDPQQWNLVAGRRRLRAVVQHNMAADKPMLIDAIVGKSIKAVSQLFRRALHENTQREGLSPMDFAGNIKTVREQMKWPGAKNTKKVAEFFNCSEAQITQHEKLLDLEEKFQQALLEGKLNKEGAFALLKVKAAKRDEVFESASKKQKAELGELAIAQAAQPAPKDATASTTPKAKKSGAAKSGGVKAKHVKAAAREADPEARQPRSKRDILDFFEGCQGPVYGYEDGAVYQFVEAFKKFVKGEIQNRTLDKYFDAMVSKADKGTPPKKSTAPKK